MLVAMAHPDLNLLVALDVLLAEASVARAARRLRLSPSAMSRTLARLREVTGDALLVRAGRALVPTPRGLELRGRAGDLVRDVETLLRPAGALDPARLTRRFTLRTSDGFVETFGPSLLTRVQAEAPSVRLRFVPKPDKDSTPLRENGIDLETGIVGRSTGPELRAQALFRDRFIGVAPPGHPLLQGDLTLDRYAAARHVRISRRDQHAGPIDAALSAMGLRREIAVSVSGFSAALALVRGAGLLAAVPERHTAGLRQGLACFDLPFALPEMTISLLWHPRMDGDLAHRWLRGCVREVCAA